MIKAGDRVRRIGIPLYHGRGEEYDVGSEWTVQSISIPFNRINLRELPGTWDLNRFELVKEGKMCTCNEQSGVCSDCAKKYKRQELIPGKKYKHPDWCSPNIYLTKTSTGKLVFEDSSGGAFTTRHTCDFTEVKEKKKGWVNIYKEFQNVKFSFHDNKESADKAGRSPTDEDPRTACIEVEYYEGQGL